MLRRICLPYTYRDFSWQSWSHAFGRHSTAGRPGQLRCKVVSDWRLPFVAAKEFYVRENVRALAKYIVQLGSVTIIDALAKRRFANS